MYTINWRGDKCGNHGSREGREPIAIANHITAGTRGSVYNWFVSPNNRNASSHFVVTREGEIDQYVRLESAAWTQGLNPKKGDTAFATAPIVKEQGVNPNLYMIGIEHEGYVQGHLSEQGVMEIVNYGLDGDLTEKQFWASCWLHKFIQTEVQRIYGIRIPLNSHNVVGHFQIDPRRKPNCPGPKFPWTRLYAEMVIAESMTLELYEERINWMNQPNVATAYIFATRISHLESQLTDPRWGARSRELLMRMAGIMPVLGLTGELTAESIAKKIGEIYKNAQPGGKFTLLGLQKLMIGTNEAKKQGLLV